MRASLLFIALISIAYGLEFHIDVPQLVHSVDAGAESFSIESYGSTTDNYLPVLPSKGYLFEIPMNAEDVRIRAEADFRLVRRTSAIKERQPPLPQNRDRSYRVPARKQHNLKRFPESIYSFNGVRIKDGIKYASVTIFPVRYFFAGGRVEYADEFTVHIDYNLSREMPFSAGTPEAQDASAVKYAIITTSALKSKLIPLKEWKNQKGVSAEIYDVEGIYANTSGADNPEKIRNFLVNLENSADLDWVLLAGDVADVPTRSAYCNDSYSGDGDYVPTDHYYADLIGGYSPYDWDFDNDGKYGEMNDLLDWIADAYVGRLSSSNSAQMQSMVENIINYERNPPSGAWAEKSILAAAESDETTDEATLMESIRTNLLPGYTNERVYYLTNYARDYALDFTNFEARAGEGASIVTWAGHGSYTSAHVSSTGSAFASTSTNPPNSDKRPMVYADSCSTGGFDQASSLGESVIRDWGIGFVGASRVSWYCVGWSGPSDPWNQAMAYRFNEQLASSHKPGKALFDSKEDYINDFSASYEPDSDIYSRKNFFNYNLLGDPEIDLWSESPLNMTLNNTEEIFGNSTQQIDVYILNGTTALQGAQVTLYNGADVAESGTTDLNGHAGFSVSTASGNSLTVTATKRNFRPLQANISVGLSPVYVIPISPKDQLYTNPSALNFSFSVNSTNPIANCSLVINGEAVMGDDSIEDGINSFLWADPFGGDLEWGVLCEDSIGAANGLSTENIKVIVMESYTGTNLSDVDIENISNLVVEQESYGFINFTVNVNLSSGVDLNEMIIIRENYIFIDSGAAPFLNKSAVLTIYNVDFGNPVVMRDGEICTDCNITEVGANYVRFSVGHFSAYHVTGSTADEVFTGSLTETTPGSDIGSSGNVSSVNLTAVVSTDRWQGYFGNVSGGLILGTALTIFYDFSQAGPTQVYSSQNQDFDFTRLSNTTASAIDNVWGYNSGNDQATDMYVSVTRISNVSAYSVELNPNDWNSTILDNGTDTIKLGFAFGVNIIDEGVCFDASVCDYELVVPADGLETYYFFVGI